MTSLILSLAALFAAVSGGAATGELGMRAPAPQFSEVIKGKPVQWDENHDTNIYVLEFWATWCGPCKISIPELSKLQLKFKDRGVRIVGISDEEPGLVKPFVEKMGDKMDYTVVTDLANRTTEAYMRAFGAQGIPHAFIVGRDRRILWEGHPMMGLEQALEQVANGTFDVEKARGMAQVQKDFQQYFRLVCTVGASPEGERLGRAILSGAADSAPVLWKFSGVILDDPRVRHRDLKLALEAAEKANTLTSNREPAVLQNYARALASNARQEEAIRIQEKALGLTTREEDRKLLSKGLEELRRNRSADK